MPARKSWRHEQAAVALFGISVAPPRCLREPHNPGLDTPASLSPPVQPLRSKRERIRAKKGRRQARKS